MGVFIVIILAIFLSILLGVRLLSKGCDDCMCYTCKSFMDDCNKCDTCGGIVTECSGYEPLHVSTEASKIPGICMCRTFMGCAITTPKDREQCPKTCPEYKEDD